MAVKSNTLNLKPDDETSAPASTGETVTVACKLPHGLHLRIFKMVDHQDPLPGGGTKTVQRAVPIPQTVIIRGYLDKYDPNLPPAAKNSSFAVTEGVPKEFWDLWTEQNKDFDALVNGLIFAHSDIKGAIREHVGVKSGLEPVNPANLKGKVKTFKADEEKA